MNPGFEEFPWAIFSSLPIHYSAYRIRLRVELASGSHTFSPLVSQMTVYNMDADDTLALMCWNTEVRTKFETHGYAIAKTFQTNLLELGIDHHNFPTALRACLVNHPYYLRWEPL